MEKTNYQKPKTEVYQIKTVYLLGNGGTGDNGGGGENTSRSLRNTWDEKPTWDNE